MNNPNGSFIWYELATPDPDAAAKFYGRVIGWTIGGPAEPAPEGKDYRMIVRTDGGFAGGVLKLTPEMAANGARPTWLGYLQVSDVDAAVKAVLADGGRLLMPRLDIPVGSFALVMDPLGTPFYVMTPIAPADKPDMKSDVFDPMATERVRWNELASPDLARAKAFYAKHFGFAFNETMSMGELGDYCFIAHGGIPMIGAIMQQPLGTPSRGWLFYFGVDSVVAAKAAIEVGGGKVLMGPHEVPGGQWIVVADDPQGAGFGVVGPKGA